MATYTGIEFSSERLEEDEQRSKRERREKHEREQQEYHDADIAQMMSGSAEEQKADLVRKRRTPRARATRLEKDYEPFSKKNPDPSLFTTYNHAELDEMRLRAEELKSELSNIDKEVSHVMLDPYFTQYDVEFEVDQADKYSSKLHRVIACSKLVEADRETETQVKLNLSRSGMSPGATHQLASFSGVRPEDSRPSTPAHVPRRGIFSPAFGAPTSFLSPHFTSTSAFLPVSTAAAVAPGTFFVSSAGSHYAAPVTSVTYSGGLGGSSLVHPAASVLPPPAVAVYPKYSGVKTPEIKLPEFSGDPLLWPSFIDRFLSLIDNDIRFSEVHKLEYLKSSLKGEPSRMLQNLQSISTNYRIALSMLRSRYEDEWPMIAKHLEAMFGFKTIVGKSSKELRRLHEVFSINTGGLQVLGYPFDNWICVFLLSSKLDQESRELWEKLVVELPRCFTSGKITIPSYVMMMSFIDQRARTLEHSSHLKNGLAGQVSGGASKKTTPHAGVNSSVTSAFSNQGKGAVSKRPADLPVATGKQKSLPAAQNCPQCKESDHRLWSCKKFAELSLDARKASVAASRLCFNCLGTGHNAPNCTSKYTCKTCKKKHHTLLHVADL